MSFADTKKFLFNFNNDEVVCPYCGYKDEDTFEYNEDESEVECLHCNRKFVYVREICVKYTTHRIDDDGEVDYDDLLIEEEQ